MGRGATEHATRGRAWPLLGVLCAAALLPLAGCGESGGPAPAEQETAVGSTSAEKPRVAEPPSETVPEGGDRASTAAGEDAEEELAGDVPSAPEPCPDVVVAPDSGAGLFGLEVQQLTCSDATTALMAWGEAGFPGDSPPGFVCEQLAENPDGSTRLRCTQGDSGGVLEFSTGS